MLRSFLSFATLVFLGLALIAAGGGADAPARGVAVVSLPGGEREIVGFDGFEGHHLLVSANGTVSHWTDSDGNRPLAMPEHLTPAVELADASNVTMRLLPAAKTTPEVEETAGEVRVTLAAPAGARLIYIVQPDRLGLRVEGPAKGYALVGRCPCRAEGCRIVAGGRDHFVSAGLESIKGRQRLVDARRSRALELNPPEGVSIQWRLTFTDGWAWTKEHLSWTASLAPGQTVWLASAPATPPEGPVDFGLFQRRLFRPEGGPVAVATLSSHRVRADEPVRLSLSRPVEKVLAGAVLLAALLSTEPRDPIEESEQGTWFTRFDTFTGDLIPVELRPEGDRWTLRLKREMAPGVYRLRVWLAPRDTPRPEALGGPAGAVVPYFPGFEGRANATHQAAPMGDVLITVASSATGSLAIVHPGQRASFWRGEPIDLAVQARGREEAIAARLTVRRDRRPIIVEALVKLPAGPGFAMTEVRVATDSLAPGVYEAAARADGLATVPYRFTIAPTPASGMPVLNSPLSGPADDLEPYERLGVTGWVDVMPQNDGFTPRWPAAATTGWLYRAGEPSMARTAPADPGPYDRLVRDNWLLMQGIQSRQISFAIHHSVPEQVEETLRKHLVFAQLGRRFPSTLGLVFDYDLSGTSAGYAYAPGYTKAGQRRVELLKKRWEAAWEDAKRHGATEADRPRIQHLFHAGVIADIYRRSTGQLHAAIPEQRHTSSVTADHNDIQNGQYLPAIYAPLDFRYLECWNDQIYPNGAHDMQESFWTALLRMEKPAGQPLWVTVPTAPQPGTHFRRTLDATARGATGTGYNAEGAAGLTGGWGVVPSKPDIRAAQESLTGDLAQRYGSWLRAFEPAEEIAILYSVSQGGNNYGLQSPMFFAWYTLAQLNRPARLITEDEVASGKLKDIKALLLVQQTVKLPDATLKAIEAFAAGGGKVLCDRDTKVLPAGAKRLDKVGWPGSLWPNGSNTFHNLIDAATRSNRADLLAALGDAGRPPLACEDGKALVVAKRAPGGATLVIVTNNRAYPFGELFSADQRAAAFFRIFTARGSTFFKDVRVPTEARLTFKPGAAPEGVHLYDVFAGRELAIDRSDGAAGMSVDLATLTARVLLLTAAPIEAPALFVGDRAEDDPRVTLVTRSAVPLPVRIRAGGQEFYRAATAAGSCDTIALAAPGESDVDVTELVTGRQVTGTLRLSAMPTAAVRELPPVQVLDATRLRAVLKAPGLAVYVDAGQAGVLPLARRLAERLGAEAVFNPPVRDYPLAWDRSAADDAAVAAVQRDRVLARRRAAETYIQWTGALTPATVWDRPVLLFGHAANNRLIADLDSVTFLSRPATPEAIGPGRAVVQPVASPFWNGRDAAVVLCADEAGLTKAVDRLIEVAAGKDGDAIALAEDGGARAERRRALGFDPPVYPEKLVPLGKAGTGKPVPLAPVVPVNVIAPVAGGFLATLHSPGRNLVRFDPGEKVLWHKATAGFYQPAALFADDRGEAVIGDDAFLWRHAADGAVRWKTLGKAIQAPLADGSVWVLADDGLRQIDQAGRVVATAKVLGRLLVLTPDGRRAVVHLPGDAKAGRARADAALALVELPGGKEVWKVPNMDAADARISGDGSVIACIEHEDMAGRDDLDRADASRLAALDAATGKVLFRRPLGAGLADLRISHDGKRLVAAREGFSNALFVADVPGNLVRRIVVPEKGAWARLLEASGRRLWVAGERLYRIDLDTLRVEPILDRRLLALAPRGDGGVYAGAPDGTVVRLGASGRLVGRADLAAGITVDDVGAALKPLREAPDVASPSLNPHVPPCTIALGPEYPLEYMTRGEAVVPRGDGIVPPQVAIRIPAAGKYRFTFALDNAKDHADKMGQFALRHGEKPLGTTAFRKAGPWMQDVELDLAAGTYLLDLSPAGWKEDPIMRTLEVREAGK
jgi:hypothetical protein